MCDEALWPGAIANNAKEFAQKAVALYQDEGLWQRGQQHIQQALLGFDKRTIGPALISHIIETKRTLSAHRLKNFTGSMLQHHHHKSTQYMAQWIEAKNRSIDNSKDHK